MLAPAEQIRALESLFAASYDGLFIADGEGVLLQVNEVSERVFGLPAAEACGRNVADLEREGIFSPSATLAALTRRQTVSFVQQTAGAGYRVVTATPVLDDHGAVAMVVGYSRPLAETVTLSADARREADRLGGQGFVAHHSIPVIAASPQMRELLSQVYRIARTTSTVLIQGESGVGKDVIAHLLHKASPRHEGPFVKINCGAIPETLIESELFGYEKGAFTGASQAGRPGKIEAAAGGTLFLDEVGELPLPMQVKLLEVTEERTFLRVGGSRPVRVDIRLISATNQNLLELVQLGKFRKDLYYRLNVVPVAIPPLRERPADVAPLALAYLSQFNQELGGHLTLAPGTMELLERYHWPGNVRELQNLVEQLVVSSGTPVVTPAMLPQEIKAAAGAGGALVNRALAGPGVSPETGADAPYGGSLSQRVAELEKALIRAAYARSRSSHKAAGMLGIHFSTISRKVAQYFGSFENLRRLIAQGETDGRGDGADFRSRAPAGSPSVESPERS